MIRIPFDEAKKQLKSVLLGRGVDEEKAEKVAHEMTRNSLEGIYTHGIHRFLRLVRNIDEGIVRIDVMPECIHQFGAIANYDGKMGLGIVNASFAMDRCLELAREHGIGLVALRNTNHWLRAATYAYQACEHGMAAMCFSNTMPNMPTWGAVDSRIGNNPLTLAFPHPGADVVVDMAMSQFSYGALELARLERRKMPIDAGFDTHGNLTRDPAEVIASQRILPTGYWKGAALSFVLDTFAACMSLGNTTAMVGRLPGDEHGLSQMFIAINFEKIAPMDQAQNILEASIKDLLASQKDEHTKRIIYTGEMTMETKRQNLKNGIPVDESIWSEIMKLAASK